VTGKTFNRKGDEDMFEPSIASTFGQVGTHAELDYFIDYFIDCLR
jgi:hypothetical protein